MVEESKDHNKNLNRDEKGRFRKGFTVGHKFQKGQIPWNYNGGRIIRQGYIKIIKKDHPFADFHGYVFEHRIVWEQANDAMLLPWAIVHHINENRSDNRIENLEAHIRRDHNFIHKPKKDMSDRKCHNCGSDKTRIYKHKNGLYYISWYKTKDKKDWLCRNCYRKSL